jgi:allophanate hydrolase
MKLSDLDDRYRAGEKPTDVIAELYDSIVAQPLTPVWISLVPREVVLDQARASRPESPLHGVPFAIKDNIDFEGLPTTAGCPAFAYQPEVSATVVQRLMSAGAVLIGKTNMDQFATGLVGTRSPHGACSSVYSAAYISGGSSSGSAVAVAQGQVAFSLGTDTAGSGRVPAAFNNLVGLKPTRGLISAAGVVPACRTLDCVSIFANSCSDASEIFKAAHGFDAADPYSRVASPGDGASPWLNGPFRFGIPSKTQLEFFGDLEAESLYEAAVARLEEQGGQRVEIDFSSFRAAADLLYSGPWVAERTAAVGDFLAKSVDAMDPVVRKIIAGGSNYGAVDTFQAQYRLEELRGATKAEWSKMDVLFLPTTGTIYTHEQIRAEPIQKNTNLGYYTNFVNLLDLSAVAVPAGFRSNGLPFGVSFIGAPFADEALVALGGKFLCENPRPSASPVACVQVAVVGAHLSGQPLNHQLIERGGRLDRAVRTAPEYRLYALHGTVPPKPGLIREEGFEGPGIELEVWNIPENQFGGFVAAIPRPLSIGDVRMEDGSFVKCFLCEPAALKDAREITDFRSWRAYLKHLSTP